MKTSLKKEVFYLNLLKIVILKKIRDIIY